MFYQLHMHGRWITHTGRKNFETREELWDYFASIYEESFDTVKKLYNYDDERIDHLIENSVSVYKLSDHMKVKDTYKTTHIKRVNIVYKDVKPEKNNEHTQS